VIVKGEPEGCQAGKYESSVRKSLDVGIVSIVLFILSHRYPLLPKRAGREHVGSGAEMILPLCMPCLRRAPNDRGSVLGTRLVGRRQGP